MSFDCFGLFLHAFNDILGVEIPDFFEEADYSDVVLHLRFREVIEENFRYVQTPDCGDVLWIADNGVSPHIALFTSHDRIVEVIDGEGVRADTFYKYMGFELLVLRHRKLCFR